ncbi:5-methyltetrahydropteroyltriglutamate--homocysteine S-methyltransferase [Buchnera aphidicola]|uniref:5-methyltetrahydropteroyltriglutamate-- homocysteine S-methyltransferase n=1 Tax=Buchnera aphidicola TaxID=9 RepID=UPI003464ABEA
MAIINHILGFPRIGLHRELKRAQEKYWSGKISQDNLLVVGKELRKEHWFQQKKAGINLLPVGDFAWYDHVLSTSMLLGNIPQRHRNEDGSIDLDTLFRIARGIAPTGQSALASDMTKWFNTNYHYIVPEFTKNYKFFYGWTQLLDEVDEALTLGHKIKPVILGPMTYLWLGKVKGDAFNRLDLLPNIIPIYQYIFSELERRGIDWVQIDEPILALELPDNWLKLFNSVYQELKCNIKLLLTTYFDSVNHNIDVICQFPIQGLHIDLVYGKYDLYSLNDRLPEDWILSLGIINGRNVWRADLEYYFGIIQLYLKKRKNLWIGSSCSLLHSPLDVTLEKNIDQEIINWFSFAIQKCQELALLTKCLNSNNNTALKKWSDFIKNRSTSDIVNNLAVQKREKLIQFNQYYRKNPYIIRSKKQGEEFHLPILPTTTIGSFPQTDNIRKLRLDFKKGDISYKNYKIEISRHIKDVIYRQDVLGLDVLVHGEFERNDMVEYFGENLDGFIFTNNAWIQSYGSRCVKPPIIIGDVSRSKPISIEWAKYAQSLTNKPVKGMLTGPVTILLWSFAREDISKETIARQIALALRDEVKDLENIGIKIIQIDEPALREGLPLRKSHWQSYLTWAVNSFRLTSSIVKDETQIHTHMCYCEFNDIMNSIIDLDADVITIETSRSDMELLDFFKEFKYPNAIGPGVYDIHSPTIPTVKSIEILLRKIISCLQVEQVWVNPDCGLKTRTWEETELSLKNMIQATKNLRKEINKI